MNRPPADTSHGNDSIRSVLLPEQASGPNLEPIATAVIYNDNDGDGDDETSAKSASTVSTDTSASLSDDIRRTGNEKELLLSPGFRTDSSHSSATTPADKRQEQRNTTQSTPEDTPEKLSAIPFPSLNHEKMPSSPPPKTDTLQNGGSSSKLAKRSYRRLQSARHAFWGNEPGVQIVDPEDPDNIDIRVVRDAQIDKVVLLPGIIGDALRPSRWLDAKSFAPNLMHADFNRLSEHIRSEDVSWWQTLSRVPTPLRIRNPDGASRSCESLQWEAILKSRILYDRSTLLSPEKVRDCRFSDFIAFINESVFLCRYFVDDYSRDGTPQSVASLNLRDWNAMQVGENRRNVPVASDNKASTEDSSLMPQDTSFLFTHFLAKDPTGEELLWLPTQLLVQKKSPKGIPASSSAHLLFTSRRGAIKVLPDESWSAARRDFVSPSQSIRIYARLGGGKTEGCSSKEGLSTYSRTPVLVSSINLTALQSPPSSSSSLSARTRNESGNKEKKNGNDNNSNNDSFKIDADIGWNNWPYAVYYTSAAGEGSENPDIHSLSLSNIVRSYPKIRKHIFAGSNNKTVNVRRTESGKGQRKKTPHFIAMEWRCNGRDILRLIHASLLARPTRALSSFPFSSNKKPNHGAGEENRRQPSGSPFAPYGCKDMPAAWDALLSKYTFAGRSARPNLWVSDGGGDDDRHKGDSGKQSKEARGDESEMELDKKARRSEEISLSEYKEMKPGFVAQERLFRDPHVKNGNKNGHPVSARIVHHQGILEITHKGTTVARKRRNPVGIEAREEEEKEESMESAALQEAYITHHEFILRGDAEWGEMVRDEDIGAALQYSREGPLLRSAHTPHDESASSIHRNTKRASAMERKEKRSGDESRSTSSTHSKPIEKGKEEDEKEEEEEMRWMEARMNRRVFDSTMILLSDQGSVLDMVDAYLERDFTLSTSISLPKVPHEHFFFVEGAQNARDEATTVAQETDATAKVTVHFSPSVISIPPNAEDSASEKQKQRRSLSLPISVFYRRALPAFFERIASENGEVVYAVRARYYFVENMPLLGQQLLWCQLSGVASEYNRFQRWSMQAEDVIAFLWRQDPAAILSESEYKATLAIMRLFPFARIHDLSAALRDSSASLQGVAFSTPVWNGDVAPSANDSHPNPPIMTDKHSLQHYANAVRCRTFLLQSLLHAVMQRMMGGFLTEDEAQKLAGDTLDMATAQPVGEYRDIAIRAFAIFLRASLYPIPRSLEELEREMGKRNGEKGWETGDAIRGESDSFFFSVKMAWNDERTAAGLLDLSPVMPAQTTSLESIEHGSGEEVRTERVREGGENMEKETCVEKYRKQMVVRIENIRTSLQDIIVIAHNRRIYASSHNTPLPLISRDMEKVVAALDSKTARFVRRALEDVLFVADILRVFSVEKILTLVNETRGNEIKGKTQCNAKEEDDDDDDVMMTETECSVSSLPHLKQNPLQHRRDVEQREKIYSGLGRFPYPEYLVLFLVPWRQVSLMSALFAIHSIYERELEANPPS